MTVISPNKNREDFHTFKKEVLDDENLMKFDYKDLKKYFNFPYKHVVSKEIDDQKMDDYVSSEDVE